MPHAKVSVGWIQLYRELLLFGEWQHDILHRAQNRENGEGLGARIDQAIAAARERDHVTRNGAQSERGAVDESERSLLYGVHFPALPFAQSLRQEQNRCERRAQIVSDLDEQLETTWAREARAEAVRIIVLDDLAHSLDCAQHAQNFLPVHSRAHRAELRDQAPAQGVERERRGRGWMRARLRARIERRCAHRVRHPGYAVPKIGIVMGGLRRRGKLAHGANGRVRERIAQRRGQCRRQRWKGWKRRTFMALTRRGALVRCLGR